MYTLQDVLCLTRQLLARTILWFIPETILLAGVIAGFILRIQWLTSLLFFFLGALVLFTMNLFILPVLRYRQFLSCVLHGKTSRSTAVFAAFDENAVIREGVRFYPLIMRVNSPKEGLDERRYFWDANLSKPVWYEGDRITLLSHEGVVVSWEAAAPDVPLSA